jgi:drug/metabolite transporter (DMT)-like permease
LQAARAAGARGPRRARRLEVAGLVAARNDGTIAGDASAPPPSIVNRTLALLALHAAVLLFGFAALFGQWLALSPLLIVLARTAVAASALGLVRLAAPAERRPFALPLLANGAVLALHWVSFFAAVQVSNVATALLGYASFPLFALLLERAPARARWSARELGVVAGVMAGLVLMVPEFSLGNRAFAGLLWGVVSGFTFALLAVLNRRHAARRPAIDIAYWQNLCAAAALLPLAPLALDALPGARDVGAREVALLLALGLVCTALAHTLFIASLREVTARTASVVAALEPVYGIALAFVLLGERPDARVLAGGVLIVGAALVATTRREAPQ